MSVIMADEPDHVTTVRLALLCRYCVCLTAEHASWCIWNPDWKLPSDMQPDADNDYTVEDRARFD
jgi:hypothetical protein